MRFVILDSVKNLRRHGKRYFLLGSLLFLCALLSGAALTLASCAKLYLAHTPIPDAFDEIFSTQMHRVLSLDSAASASQAGILLVSAAALFYASSIAVNERMGDIGILYSIGLSGKTVFCGMLLEIGMLACLTLVPGCMIGRRVASLWICAQAAAGTLPPEMPGYIKGAGQTAVLLVFTCVILLFPAGSLAVRIAKSDPCDLLRERK